MYCPTCGQQQLAENVRFCSRCGFLLTGISEVIANNGVIPALTAESQDVSHDSPRKRGLKQGLMILLVGMLLIVPLAAMFHLATNTEPLLVAISAIISFWGGILRMIYAVMYESKFPENKSNGHETSAKSLFGKVRGNKGLPPQQSVPVEDYVSPRAGNWHTTNDLVAPPSVTDHTTKILQQEKD